MCAKETKTQNGPKFAVPNLRALSFSAVSGCSKHNRSLAFRLQPERWPMMVLWTWGFTAPSINETGPPGPMASRSLEFGIAPTRPQRVVISLMLLQLFLQLFITIAVPLTDLHCWLCPHYFPPLLQVTSLILPAVPPCSCCCC